MAQLTVITERALQNLFVAFMLFGWAPVLAADAPADDSQRIVQAVGQRVTVELHSGVTWEEAELVEVDVQADTGKIDLLRLRTRAGKLRPIGVRSLRRVIHGGETIFEADTSADRDDAPSDEKPDRMSSRERRAARRAAEAAAAEQERTEARRQWLARLEARGVEPWPEETQEQHDAAIERYRQMISEVDRFVPGMQLYETEQFLFSSNIPPAQVAPYVKYLDRMHEWMCTTYGIAADERVWLGKCLVFAFVAEEQFLAFERRYFATSAVDAYGVCHSSSRGDVVIACYRGDDPDDFGQMLVHETSHGFIHRYKSKARLPNWVNEGMAELIGAIMVPSSDAVKKKEQLALKRLRETRSLGGNFFAAERPLATWQYGIASGMARFMLTASQENYVHFIEQLKEGVPWDEALAHAYGATPQQLVTSYGQWIGVPDLRP